MQNDALIEDQVSGAPQMDDEWDADVEVERNPSGRYVAVLVLRPPTPIGPAVRLPIGGEYEHPMQAEVAALDAFAAMTRGG